MCSFSTKLFLYLWIYYLAVYSYIYTGNTVFTTGDQDDVISVCCCMDMKIKLREVPVVTQPAFTVSSFSRGWNCCFLSIQSKCAQLLEAWRDSLNFKLIPDKVLALTSNCLKCLSFKGCNIQFLKPPIFQTSHVRAPANLPKTGLLLCIVSVIVLTYKSQLDEVQLLGNPLWRPQRTRGSDVCAALRVSSSAVVTRRQLSAHHMLLWLSGAVFVCARKRED